MSYVTSKDGTIIGYDVRGSGPAIVLVDGAMCYREGNSPMPELAKLLADDFTVYTYDRRGRGESGDVQPYDMQREIEDIEALVNVAGGAAGLYGISSGAILATYAASALNDKITKLAVYEAPLVLDETRPIIPDTYVDDLKRLIASGKRGEAVQLFMKDAIGMPGMLVKIMPWFPGWSKGLSIAHTLVYDGIITKMATDGRELVARHWANATMSVLVTAGGKSSPWIQNGNTLFAQTFRDAQFQIIPGQNHMLKPAMHAPVIRAFFSAE